MRRIFIELDKLDIYDEFHFRVGEDFGVNEKLDGNTTEYHREGIALVKDLLERGDKVRPILVLRDGQRFKLLDGFKRAKAHLALGYPLIEAYVCDEANEQIDPFHKETRACKGGQSELPWLEGETEILYWKGGDGLRIEKADGGYHIHWGLYGKYKLAVGEDDMQILKDAITKI